jgi:hypothetical protein
MALRTLLAQPAQCKSTLSTMGCGPAPPESFFSPALSLPAAFFSPMAAALPVLTVSRMSGLDGGGGYQPFEVGAGFAKEKGSVEECGGGGGVK